MADWSQLFGTPDLNKFDEFQRRELLIGLSEGLPYQLYADPNLSAFEMKEFRVILSRTALVREGPEAALREGMQPGFKSEVNYKLHPEEVCYIPENWDMAEDGPGYTAKDILQMCNGDKDLADMVFNLCDWQHPSTVLDEMDRDDEIALLEIKKEKMKVLQEEISEIENSLDPKLPPPILYLTADTPAEDAVVESITLKLKDGTTASLQWIEEVINHETDYNIFRGKFLEVSFGEWPFGNDFSRLSGAELESVEIYSESMPDAPFNVTDIEICDGVHDLYFEVENGCLTKKSSEERFRSTMQTVVSHDIDDLPFVDAIIRKADNKRQTQASAKDAKGKEHRER